MKRLPTFVIVGGPALWRPGQGYTARGTSGLMGDIGAILTLGRNIRLLLQ